MIYQSKNLESTFERDNMKKKLKNNVQRITANFTGTTRFDSIGDKQYLVAPMVMLTEGVHEGSGGALYYPQEELNDCPQAWNHKPVVVYHPEANGQGVSACDPIILSNRMVGIIMNAKVEKITVNKKSVDALKAEAWLEQDRCDAVDERISNAIETNTMMELSTGLFTKTDNEEGEWEGEKYVGIARNYRPDHLALLPDLKGACSIEDGAGLLRNQTVLKINPEVIQLVNNAMSHGNVRSLLNSWLWEKHDDAWIEAVYDDFFIYELSGKFYSLNYTLEDNVVTIDGIQGETEVVRVTEFRTKSGEFVGNNRKESIMDKKKVVQSIIASNSNSWTEKDKETLMALDEEVITKMQESETLAGDTAVENAVKLAADKIELDDKKKADADAETIANADKTNDKPKTAKQWLKDAPPEIATIVNGAMKQTANVKLALIKRITSNDSNVFSEDQLKTMEIDTLRGIASLAVNTIEDEESDLEVDFAALGLHENAEQSDMPEPMLPPTVMSEAKE